MHIKNNLPNSVIIAGGGVQNMHDVYSYQIKGAQHFSASSVFFNPFLAFQLYMDYYNRK